MMRALAAALMLGLAACSTVDVQRACVETEQICRLVKPGLDFAPSSVQLATGMLCGGAAICGTPQYAAMREQVIAWLRSKGVRL